MARRSYRSGGYLWAAQHLAALPHFQAVPFAVSLDFVGYEPRLRIIWSLEILYTESRSIVAYFVAAVEHGAPPEV